MLIYILGTSYMQCAKLKRIALLKNILLLLYSLKYCFLFVSLFGLYGLYYFVFYFVLFCIVIILYCYYIVIGIILYCLYVFFWGGGGGGGSYILPAIVE